MVLGETEVMVYEVEMLESYSGEVGSGAGKGKGKEKESEKKRRRSSGVGSSEGGGEGLKGKVIGAGPRGVSGKLPGFGEITA